MYYANTKNYLKEPIDGSSCIGHLSSLFPTNFVNKAIFVRERSLKNS